MKRKEELQLFKVVRQGYDPYEVLECFEDFLKSFKKREEQHTKEYELACQELIRLKEASYEEQQCLKELKEQLEQERRENQRLRAELLRAKSGGAAGESDCFPRSPQKGGF